MIKQQVTSYLRYWLHAVDHHSLHSPFLFDFYTRIIRHKTDPHAFDDIEIQRKHLLRDTSSVTLKGFGAGSKHFRNASRSIGSVAKTSLTPAKYGRLYANIIQYFQASSILELGTSLGINTAYLACKKDTQVTTFEGEPEISTIAKSVFEQMNITNIRLIEGDIDKTLPAFLANHTTIDFAFLDANHQLEPTVRYFEAISKKIHTKSVVIIDDIHQSAGMEKAWNRIKFHDLVYCSIDLYRCGIVFFDPSLHKQHVVLQF